MTVLAVAVGTAFLLGVLALRGALSNIAADAVGAFSVYDGMVLGPEENSPSGTPIRGSVSADTATQVESVAGTADVQDMWTSIVLLYNAEGEQLLPGQTPSFATATMQGADWPRWTEGHAPAGAGEIAVIAPAAEKHGIAVGDTLEVGVGGQFLPQEVVGLFEFSSDVAGTVIVFMDPDTAAQLLSMGGPPQMVGFNIAAGSNPAEVLDAVQETLGDQYSVMSNAQYVDYMEEQSSTMLGFLTTFLLVFVAIALFITTFIISNTFQMSVRARQHEFALLRALGTSGRQVFGIVAAQALVIGLAGGTAGLGLGWLLTLGASALLDSMGAPLSGGLPISGASIAITILVGLVVTLISAILPAMGAAQTAPVAAMRDSEGANPTSPWGRSLIGAVGVAAGAVLLILGAGRHITWSGLALGLGAVLVLVAILVLSPTLAIPGSTALSWPIRLFAPTQGRLAVTNLVRNPRRTAATAGALLVGVALVSAGSVLASSVKTSLASAVSEQLKADLVVQSADIFNRTLPEATEQVVARQPGVEGVYWDVADAQVSVVDGAGQPQTQPGVFIDPDYLQRFVEIPLDEGRLPSEGEFVAQTSVAEQLGAAVGDTVTFQTGEGEHQLTLSGTFGSAILSGSVFIPYRYLDQLATGQVQDHSAMFVETDGDDVQQVKEELRAAVKDLRIVTVDDAADMTDQAAASVDQVMGILYALLGLSLFVAAIGIINTMTLSVSERIREFGLLRAVGFSRGSVAGMVIIESVLTAVYATIVGCVVGVGLAAALQSYLKDSGLATLSVPYGQLFLYVGVAIVLGVIAAILPAVRAARVPVLDAISSD